jgi:transglutaminase-like putative cysteine protease
MKNLILVSLLCSIPLFLKPAYAQTKFLVSAEAIYDIPQSGSAKVTHNVSITNATTEFHATDFILSVRGAEVKDVVAYSVNDDLKSEILHGDGIDQIKVFFDESTVGEGNSFSFTIEYLDTSVVKRSGDVTEISIPKLSAETFDSYQLKLVVPASLGEVAYMSPPADNITQSDALKSYYFDTPEVFRAGVSAAFGQFQVFSFDLIYHLQNPLALPTKMEVAIPPDTSFQKVFYESLSPKPDNISQDGDGNWLASFKLAARERLDVRAIGTAQIFASPWKSTEINNPETYLSPTKYWQTEEGQIKELAESLSTPEKIYNYVVSNLNYNYGKVATGVERLGALDALKNPNDAICTEFTDLFIAIARASGIPAREVNGYAYTDNSALKPLSLVADVLHSWPEYWDGERQNWIPVDPTWEKTTGGVDYFSKLDMRHLSFVIHGVNPESPTSPGSYKLGANPQKDVFVSFGELPQTIKQSPVINISQRTNLPFQGLVLVAQIENPGPSALFSQKVELFYDEDKKYEDVLPQLLPFEKKTMEFSVPYGLVGNAMPEKALLIIGGSSESFKTSKNQALARDIAAVAFALVFFGFSMFVYFRRARK